MGEKNTNRLKRKKKRSDYKRKDRNKEKKIKRSKNCVNEAKNEGTEGEDSTQIAKTKVNFFLNKQMRNKKKM